MLTAFLYVLATDQDGNVDPYKGWVDEDQIAKEKEYLNKKVAKLLISSKKSKKNNEFAGEETSNKYFKWLLKLSYF